MTAHDLLFRCGSYDLAPNQIHVAGFLTIYIATRKTSEYSFSGCERGDDVVSSFGGDDQLFGEGGGTISWSGAWAMTFSTGGSATTSATQPY